MQQPEDQTSLRERAVESLRKKSEFQTHLLAYAVVNILLIIIWAATGADFFWPIFPIAGWGIGIVFHAWDAYGKNEPSEEQIRAEMDRIQRRGGS
jgi:uncharacterized membrane protein